VIKERGSVKADVGWLKKNSLELDLDAGMSLKP